MDGSRPQSGVAEPFDDAQFASVSPPGVRESRAVDDAAVVHDEPHVDLSKPDGEAVAGDECIVLELGGSELILLAVALAVWPVEPVDLEALGVKEDGDEPLVLGLHRDVRVERETLAAPIRRSLNGKLAVDNRPPAVGPDQLDGAVRPHLDAARGSADGPLDLLHAAVASSVEDVRFRCSRIRTVSFPYRWTCVTVSVHDVFRSTDRCAAISSSVSVRPSAASPGATSCRPSAAGISVFSGSGAGVSVSRSSLGAPPGTTLLPQPVVTTTTTSATVTTGRERRIIAARDHACGPRLGARSCRGPGPGLVP